MEEDNTIELKIVRRILDTKEILKKFNDLVVDAERKKISFLTSFDNNINERAINELNEYRQDLCKARGE
jgi:hypothetical protein